VRTSMPGHHHVKMPSGHVIRYARNGVRILVRERLPGGYVSLIGARYTYVGQTYFELGRRLEKLGKHGRVVVAGGGGISMKPGRYGAVLMQIQHGCLGPHEYTLAYGLLRNPDDTVMAQGSGDAAVLFKETVIPASLHADGLLIYSLLGRGATDVVTRTSSGRVVSSESYPGHPASCK
jgi:hypothetical protein